MSLFWEKLGKFKLLRSGSMSTMDIFGLTFWVIIQILDSKKVKKVNIEHKACIKCGIKVAFI